MHSHVAPYPVQFSESHFAKNYLNNQKGQTDILSLDYSGHPSVGRHSSFFGINSETDEMRRKFEEKMGHLCFQPSPTNRISKLVLSAWDVNQPFAFEEFAHLCLWNTIFAHFPEGAKPGIGL